MGSNRQPRVEELCAPRAQAALEEWSAGGHAHSDALALAKFLRARFEPELARALAEQHALRLRAATKFAPAERMLLHRKGLEQATRLDVAAWRAGRVRDCAPRSVLVDATCGLGADAIAMLRAGLPTLALESDPRTAAFGSHNVHAATGHQCVVLGSANAAPVLADYWSLDPDRREAGSSSLDPREWSPPLELALGLARAASGACMKLSPSFDLKLHAPEWDPRQPWRASFVSAGGELRECSLWFGEWASGAQPGEREAVLLREAETGSSIVSLCELPHQEPAHTMEDAAAVRWLAEPDAAVIRAGLLGNVARRAGARPLAAQLAYLGSSQPIDDPLLHSWRVLGCSPLDPKRVRRLLAEHDIGPIEVRKRGHPEAAEVLARRFAGPGGQRGQLAIARLERGHVAYLLGR